MVHKFGGTCLANADRYRNATRLLEAAGEPQQAIVVSAMAGVTDALIEILERARTGDATWAARLREIEVQQLRVASELLPEPRRTPFEEIVGADARDIHDVVRAVYLARTCSEAISELVSGYGEVWSAQLLEAYLLSENLAAAWLDARKVLVVEHRDTGPIVDWNTSRERLQPRLGAAPKLVITGYVASTPDGVPTTLKRNGSDYSASIFAALLGAESVTIWTDVDGALSADPRLVPEAVLLEELSYEEAAELAYFGAKVLHPHTMAPAIARGIPIRIRNAMRPESPGTLVHARPGRASGQAVRGLSCVDGIRLLNVQGTGMIGVPGVANRLFGALREVGVSVIVISQASSEHSICCGVPEAQAETARRAVERAFIAEIQARQIQTVELGPPCSIIAAVGDGMVETPGVAARFFAALARAGVNVRAIAQGSSERNISAVVDRTDSSRALRAAHAGFYLSEQTLSVGIVGVGLIGGELLDQLAARAAALHSQFRIDLRVRGVANSRHMLLDDQGIDLGRWREAFATQGQNTDLEAFAAHMQVPHLPRAVLVDCTASAEVAARYASWLAAGMHVVTPNKKANSGSVATYRALRDTARARNIHYLYEATVGAGLPVITTLRDLVQTGDRVLAIEGVLSGTLSYLFGQLDGDRAFSDVVREAKALGYTEPDPRDDLSGTDVARKLVILAREMGLDLELDAIPIESLVPEGLRAAPSVEAFLAGLREHDTPMRERLDAARRSGDVLRYVGTIDAERGEARAGLRAYDLSHPFARLQGGDNVFLFRTTRYAKQPLVVQGPGAGPPVTAGGVFADLLRLANYLGAPS